MSIKEIGAFEAKTHLSELLQQVERGMTFRITRRGKPIAEIVPITLRKSSPDESLVAMAKRIRKSSLKGRSTLKKMVEDGRR